METQLPWSVSAATLLTSVYVEEGSETMAEETVFYDLALRSNFKKCVLLLFWYQPSFDVCVQQVIQKMSPGRGKR